MRGLSGRIIFLLFTLVNTLSYGQEILTGVSGNPVAEEYYKNFRFSKKSNGTDTLHLPFIDDFSSLSVEPDPGLWIDKHAFINSSYAVFPVSVGVATLDALDFDGSHYENASSLPYQADFLTSKPINLQYLPSDNIWLSFFYQPQGYGEMPETGDSLCLDFYDPEMMLWLTVWSVPGQPLKPFERVMIPVTAERFLKNGFCFRFRNYASLPDNADFSDYRDNKDHWNIDYVYLNNNRQAGDTVLRDVTFFEPGRSILKDYESIPWQHFQQAYFTQRKPFIDVKYINHDSITRNVTRVLEITDLRSGFKYSPQPTANDLISGDSTHYNFPYDYPFNFSVGDTAEYRIRTILRTDAFDYKPNDTLDYIQRFIDYYALDDGTAEAGYGLRGAGTFNASVAVKFNSYREDSLRAIEMYFNQLPDNANLNYYFYINVWDNNNGKPGNLRYSQIGARVTYTDALNRFHRYKLDSAIVVKDTFYIGFTQTVEKLLNIGFDRNRNNSHRNFYTSNGQWLNSSFPGTLMMRPLISINPLVSTSPLRAKGFEYTIYPNPATELLYIKLNTALNFEEYEFSIIDLAGKTVLSDQLVDNSPIDISGLKKGMYLVKVQSRSRNVFGVQKLIIHK